MRKTALAAALALVAGIGLGTPVQAAEATTPTINWAGSAEDDLGRIRVSASSEVGITGLTAHIVTQDGKEVGTVTKFRLASGTKKDGVWHSDPVRLADLGYYRLNIEATDARGGRATEDGAGTLSYVVKMYFANLKTTKTLTYTQRKYTVSGTLMGRRPGGPETRPVSGVTVDGLVPGGDFFEGVNAVTDAKGRFAVSGEVSWADGAVGYLQAWADDTHPYHLQAYTDLAAATIDPAPTKATVQVDRTSASAGDPITVSGTATWKSPRGWEPLADANVSIAPCSPHVETHGCFSGPTTTTDAHGRYSYVVNPGISNRVEVAVSVPSEDIFVQRVTYATVKVSILGRSQFEGPYAGRNEETGQVYVGANGGLDQGGYSTAGDPEVLVQFSQDGVQGWRTMGTMEFEAGSWNAFERTFDHPGSGYWRMTYAGIKGLIAPTTTDPMYVA